MKLNFIIIILTIVFLLSFTVNSFGAETVTYSFSYSPTSFRLGIVGNPLANYTLYDYSSTSDPFVKYVMPPNLGRSSYRFYVDYRINNDFSLYSDSKYILLSCTVALRRQYTNNSASYFYFYKEDGTIYQAQISGERITELITVDFQASDMDLYSNYFVLQVDDITSFASNVAQVSYNQYFETLDTVTQAFLMSPLKIDIYDDINDVVDSINTSVNIIKEQNDVIISNQQEVIDKLEAIMNYGPSDEDISGVNSFIDETNSINESISHLEESLTNNVNSGLDQSVDMDISGAESKVAEVFQNQTIRSFFQNFNANPMVAFAFAILPTFWIAYIILFRG